MSGKNGQGLQWRWSDIQCWTLTLSVAQRAETRCQQLRASKALASLWREVSADQIRGLLEMRSQPTTLDDGEMVDKLV